MNPSRKPLCRLSVARTAPVAAVLALANFGLAGCGVLIGSVKPPVEKSSHYSIDDPSKQDSDWVKLPTQNAGDEERPSGSEVTESSDVAYQSQKTASIISLNSACRRSLEGRGAENDLRDFMKQLLLGITDIAERRDSNLSIQDVPAIETTVRGKMNSESVAIRAIVIQHASCVYDLMYVARPAHFKTQEQAFTAFVSSLRLR